MIINIPEIRASGASFALLRGDSPIELQNGAEVIVSQRKASWSLSFTIPPMRDDEPEGRRWASSLSQLSRLSNTFRAGPPGYNGPSTDYLTGRYEEDSLFEFWDDTNLELEDGSLLSVNLGWTAGGPPTVDGSGQLGYTLNVQGLANQQMVALEGDYFSVNGELKILAADVFTDSTGWAQLLFEPALRAVPANGAFVDIVNPVTQFRLSQPSAQWNRVPLFYQVQIDAVESY